MLLACEADFAAHGIESFAAINTPISQDCYICLQSMDGRHPFSNGGYDGSSDMDASISRNTSDSTTHSDLGVSGSSSSSVNTYSDASSHEIIRVQACRHIYHKACLFAWPATGSNCPQCKCQLFEPAGNKPTKDAILRILRRLTPRFGVDAVIELLEQAVIKQYEEETREHEIIGAEIGVDFWENELAEAEEESEEEAEDSVMREDHQGSGGLFGEDEDEGMIADDEDEGL
ncbi:hypothetical protein IQ07DRAFT_364598 [Pyrenochaeta sp. DS3sAY3a]|nr:hypothetical protein IQ07DRAFT_364598 [Pyrenochaeta sp. DS3sAY3a]